MQISNKQTQHFLNFNVPRMHQETKPGEATPCQAESIVGTGVDFEKIGASAHDGEEKIYKYVQEPLRKWLANFDTVVVRGYPHAACHLCHVPIALAAARPSCARRSVSQQLSLVCRCIDAGHRLHYVWLALLQVAIQTVEQLRLTLDSRRRTVSALEGAPIATAVCACCAYIVLHVPRA